MSDWRVVDLDCKHEPGVFAPHVDRAKCEGKADCVEACPYDVFVVERITDDEYGALSLLGKLKSTVHGRKTAHTPNQDQCRACGKCVTACPEHAIKLVRVSP